WIRMSGSITIPRVAPDRQELQPGASRIQAFPRTATGEREFGAAFRVSWLLRGTDNQTWPWIDSVGKARSAKRFDSTRYFGGGRATVRVRAAGDDDKVADFGFPLIRLE